MDEVHDAAAEEQSGSGLAGVVLAAGAGTRLRPLTDHLPKALVEVGGRPLVAGALERLEAVVGAGPQRLAVNAHHHAGQLAAAVAGRAHVSLEEPLALGTAGALGALAPWLGGRGALVTNADVWMPDGAQVLQQMTAAWDGERCLLLCAPAGSARADFRAPDGRPLRYVGSCLLPAPDLATLAAVPSGLYEVLWRDLDAAGRLDLHVTDAVAIDCGTPGDLAAARAGAAGRVRTGREEQATRNLCQ